MDSIAIGDFSIHLLPYALPLNICSFLDSSCSSVLPDRKQKHKTSKVHPGENPNFMDLLVFSKINPGE
jgi:hypothetical protein